MFFLPVSPFTRNFHRLSATAFSLSPFPNCCFFYIRRIDFFMSIRSRRREKESNKQKMLSIGKFAFVTSASAAVGVRDFYYVFGWGDAGGWEDETERELCVERYKLTKFDPIFQNACRCDVFSVGYCEGEWFEFFFFLARWKSRESKQRSLTSHAHTHTHKMMFMWDPRMKQAGEQVWQVNSEKMYEKVNV